MQITLEFLSIVFLLMGICPSFVKFTVGGEDIAPKVWWVCGVACAVLAVVVVNVHLKAG